MNACITEILFSPPAFNVLAILLSGRQNDVERTLNWGIARRRCSDGGPRSAPTRICYSQSRFLRKAKCSGTRSLAWFRQGSPNPLRRPAGRKGPLTVFENDSFWIGIIAQKTLNARESRRIQQMGMTIRLIFSIVVLFGAAASFAQAVTSPPCMARPYAQARLTDRGLAMISGGPGWLD